MALTRAFLKGLSLTKEQEDSIIEQHTETIEALKQQIADIQKQVESNEDFKKKFEDKQAEFDGYKQEQATKEEMAKKRNLYAKLLDETKVSAEIKDLVLKTVDYKDMKVTKEGTLQDADKYTKEIKDKYAKYIPTVDTKGAKVATPPKANGETVMTRDEIMAITDREKRREAIRNNPQAFCNSNTCRAI